MTDSYLAPPPAPRQLEIIADTDLSKAGNGIHLPTKPAAKNGIHLSTAKRGENGIHLSTASIVKKIEQARRKLGITIPRLCAEARVHQNTYRELRLGNCAARVVTLVKLQTAMSRIVAGQQADVRRTICQSYLRSLTWEMATRSGWDPEMMVNQDFSGEECPNDPVWRQAARLRRCAFYLLVEILHVGKADMAHAIGISRQAVHKGVAAVEAERDRDPQFDALMQGMVDRMKATMR